MSDASNGRGCSGDLHDVIDSNGAVVATCAPNEGCSGGSCIPVCAAAAASKGNVGCDFLVPTPMSDGLQWCFALSVTNNWSTPAHLTVSLGSQTFDVTTLAHIPNGATPASWPAVTAAGIPPQEVAVLYLSNEMNDVPCGSTPAVVGRTSVPTPNVFPYQSIGRGTAFHVTSDVPLSAYDIYPFGGASSYFPSGTMVMPTSAWGTNYVAVVPPSGTATASNGPVLQVVGSVDGTTLKIVPTIALPSGAGVVAAPANTTTSYTLDAGELIQWFSAAGAGDLSGTILAADQPVAVIGGREQLLLLSSTSSSSASDEEHEQLAPVSALGSTYVAAPFVTRQKSGAPESLPHRIVGLVNGTTLSYDPPVLGAPASLALGQVFDFEATTPFVVTSQDVAHPFYLALVTPGGSFAGGTAPGINPALGPDEFLGDPELDSFLPAAQFLPKYVFFTDPTYATTTLTVVRSKTTAFADVTVDCVGTVTGYAPIDAAGQYQVAYVDLKRAMTPVGTCKDGGHVASSAAPFGLTVRGWDRAASYGYSAGGNASTINAVVIAPVPH